MPSRQVWPTGPIRLLLAALTPAGAAIGILSGALNDDVIAVNNKLAASAAFTAGLDTTPEILGYAGDAGRCGCP